MAHVTHKTAWCTIDIDDRKGQIMLLQRWQYSWFVKGKLRAWTIKEKRDFHSEVDRRVWNNWSNKARLAVTGTSPFAKRFKSKKLPLLVDIRWVTASPHWKVSVTKIPAHEFARSAVQWKRREIILDSNDIKSRKICRSAPKKKCTSQIPVAHEFGHAFGNTAVLGRGDEYHTTSAHVADDVSIMHSGSVLRSRHFRTILSELNKAIPATTFTVASV